MALRRDAIPSPNYSSRVGSGVRLVVLHTAEGSRTYQSLGAYFQTDCEASSHVGIDDTPGVVGEYVRREGKAWTAASANPYSIQAELCGFASWSSAEWWNHPVMLENTAAWVAEECAALGIPVRRLSAYDAQHGGVGVCQHVDLGSAGGGHWDCGSTFPMDDVMEMAAGGRPNVGPPETPEQKEEAVVVSQVVKHGGQLSCAQASNGQLWHKFSQNGGFDWGTEPLIRPNGQPVKATVKDTVSISSVDGQLFIATEDEDNVAWMCRQKAGTADWDIRRLP